MTVITTTLPLHVVEMGAGEETFVLLHGFGGSMYTWHSWAPKLARRGRVIMVDMKGFGDAPKPADDHYAPIDQAELVVSLMRELELSGVTLIGHSLGGGIALLTALELLDAGEDRLSRLVLVAAAAHRQKLPPLAPLSRRPALSGQIFRLLGARRVVRWVLRSIVYDRGSITEEQVTAYARPLQTSPGLLAAMNAGSRILPKNIDEITARHHEIDVPTLLLWGTHDRVIPGWVGERLAADLPNARLAVLEQCGHIPPEERPGESLAVVEVFLDQTL